MNLGLDCRGWWCLFPGFGAVGELFTVARLTRQECNNGYLPPTSVERAHKSASGKHLEEGPHRAGTQ